MKALFASMSALQLVLGAIAFLGGDREASPVMLLMSCSFMLAAIFAKLEEGEK